VSRAALALFLGAVAGVIAAVQPISDTDLFWHLATGRETLAHGIVRSDLFSWTVRGLPVSTDQWLGQVLLYASYLGADWKGVAILRVVSVVALVSLVALNSTVARVSRPLAIVLATMPALLLTRAVWVDRPELLGFVFFAALLVLLRLGRDRRPVALIAVVLVIGFWSQVHGSFALGVVLTMLVCAEGVLRDAPRRGAYIGCAITTVVVTLATPAGLSTWTAPGAHLLSPPRDIQEWGVVDVRTPLGAAYAATLALVIACVFTGPRLPLREIVVLLPILFLSLTAMRQAPLLAIAAAPLLGERVAAAIDALTRRFESDRATEGPRGAGDPVAAQRRGARRREGFAGAVAMAAALLPAMALIVLAVAIAPGAVDERAYPVNALTSIPSGDGTLARYEWGGWLIWGAPSVPVFVDGRLTPYAGAVLDDYRRIVSAKPGWRETIAKRGVRTLLVMPGDPVAVRARELGWRALASSDGFVLIAVP
jgi:hypothetical protein